METGKATVVVPERSADIVKLDSGVKDSSIRFTLILPAPAVDPVSADHPNPPASHSDQIDMTFFTFAEFKVELKVVTCILAFAGI